MSSLLATPSFQHLIAGLAVIGVLSALGATGTITGNEAVGGILATGSFLLGGTLATTAASQGATVALIDTPATTTPYVIAEVVDPWALLTIIATICVAALGVAWRLGSVSQKVDDVARRVERIEQKIDKNGGGLRNG